METKNIIIIGQFDAVNASLSGLIEKRQDQVVKIIQADKLLALKHKLYLRKNSLIIFDLQSIKHNRLETIKKLNQENPGALIIALDQYKSEKMIDKLIDAGAHAYLSNNTSEFELNNTINLMFYYKDQFRNQFIKPSSV